MCVCVGGGGTEDTGKNENEGKDTFSSLLCARHYAGSWGNKDIKIIIIVLNS